MSNVLFIFNNNYVQEFPTHYVYWDTNLGDVRLLGDRILSIVSFLEIASPRGIPNEKQFFPSLVPMTNIKE